MTELEEDPTDQRKRCLDCDRPLRPMHTKIAQYPGTVRHAGHGICHMCRHRSKKGLPRKIEEEAAIREKLRVDETRKNLDRFMQRVRQQGQKDRNRLAGKVAGR